jgi:hypothetical protein
MKNKHKIILLLVSILIFSMGYFFWQNREIVTIARIIGVVSVQNQGEVREIKSMPYELKVGDTIITKYGSIAGIDFGDNNIKIIDENRQVRLKEIKNNTEEKEYVFLENGSTWSFKKENKGSVAATIIGWNDYVFNRNNILGVSNDKSEQKTSLDSQDQDIISRQEMDNITNCIINKVKLREQKRTNFQKNLVEGEMTNIEIFNYCLNENRTKNNKNDLSQ